VLLVLSAPCQLLVLAGPEHGRTIPLADMGLTAQAKPKLAAYTHLVFLSNEKIPEATLEDLLAQTRGTYGGPLEIGEDLTAFEIGETVTVHRFKP